MRAILDRLGVSSNGGFAYGLALVLVTLDQASKAWVIHGLKLPLRGHIDLSPVLDLTMVWNTGISFGLFGGGSARWILALFSTVMAIALAYWARTARTRLFATALGCLIAGAVGNLIDRVRLGAVADFIDISGVGFFPWVFNVADVAINVGAGLLILELVLMEWPGLRSRASTWLASRRGQAND